VTVSWSGEGEFVLAMLPPEAYSATGEKGVGVSSLTCGVLIHLTPGEWRKCIAGWGR